MGVLGGQKNQKSGKCHELPRKSDLKKKNPGGGGVEVLGQGRATFSERRPDETFRSSSWAGMTNETPKMMMYNTSSLYVYYNTFIAKQANR